MKKDCSNALLCFTHLLTVSESPTTTSDLFGRVIATVNQSINQYRSFRKQHGRMETGQGPPRVQRKPHNKSITKSRNSPFNRRFSLKKPTSPSGLLRTRLTTTASFSRPWNPSTEPSSMPGKASLRGAKSPSYSTHNIMSVTHPVSR